MASNFSTLEGYLLLQETIEGDIYKERGIKGEIIK
jgi:hypothetical protein